MKTHHSLHKNHKFLSAKGGLEFKQACNVRFIDNRAMEVQVWNWLEARKGLFSTTKFLHAFKFMTDGGR